MRHLRHPRSAPLFAVLAAFVIGVTWSSPVAAASLEGLAGWEGGDVRQGYGFIGIGALQPMGARLTLVTRLSASYLYYTFESSGTSTSVTSPGVTGMTGLRTMLARGSFAVLGGYETRWEERRRGVGTDERGLTGGGVVQADADQGLGRRWRGFLSVNYAGAARYLFGRLAVRWQATNLDWKDPLTSFLGLEGIRQGNNESAALQSGPFLEWTFVPQRLSVALHAGYKDSWSPDGPHRRGAYAGLSVYHRF